VSGLNIFKFKENLYLAYYFHRHCVPCPSLNKHWDMCVCVCVCVCVCKPWSDDECSKLIDQRKQAKLQWLQNPSQINWDNLQTLRYETSRTFRKKKREYVKHKINDHETNNKNKIIRDLYRGIN
jgi:hypothetical protein